MKSNPNTPESKIEKRVKKRYRSPQVFVYGNIRQITQAIGMSGAMADGGPPGNPKTS
jgi:hypothetical protein